MSLEYWFRSEQSRKQTTDEFAMNKAESKILPEDNRKCVKPFSVSARTIATPR